MATWRKKNRYPLFVELNAKFLRAYFRDRNNLFHTAMRKKKGKKSMIVPTVNEKIRELAAKTFLITKIQFIFPRRDSFLSKLNEDLFMRNIEIKNKLL